MGFALCLSSDLEIDLGMVLNTSAFYYSEDKEHIKDKENELSSLPLDAELIRALGGNRFKIVEMEKPANITPHHLYEEGFANAS